MTSKSIVTSDQLKVNEDWTCTLSHSSDSDLIVTVVFESKGIKLPLFLSKDQLATLTKGLQLFLGELEQ